MGKAELDAAEPNEDSPTLESRNQGLKKPSETCEKPERVCRVTTARGGLIEHEKEINR